MYASALINIDEIWLKGKNRRWYLDKLRNNLLNVVHAYQKQTVKLSQEGPKLFITSEEALSTETLQALAKIAGVSSIQPCRRAANDLEEIKKIALEEIAPLATGPKTFRVETRRLNKKFPHDSVETSRWVGGYLLKHNPNLSAKMTGQEITVSLRILNHHTFVSTKKIPGLGGVPIGTSGKAVTLISGGFDSPVASHLMFRRGLEQVFVFFHAYPFVGRDVVDKVKRLVSLLSKYQNRTRFYIVPFGPIQQKIGELCKEEYRTLLFRQYMVRVAGMVAEKEDASALITGDSLSQVSSQTLQNIAVIDRTLALPILRPLIGFNKYEIIDLARKIGTHDVSTEPQDDACALFAPKHPIIKGSSLYTDPFFAEHPLLEEMRESVEKAEVIAYNVRGEETSSGRKIDALDFENPVGPTDGGR